MADDPIQVTAQDGKVYWVRPSALMDPSMPSDENALALTNDNQAYQYVGGSWYRLLRADQVTWTANINPQLKNTRAFPFPLGRAQGF